MRTSHIKIYRRAIGNFFARFEKPLLIVVGAVLLTVVLMNLEFNLLESSLYDFRMSKGSQPAPSQDIVLISLDDQTTKVLDEFSPLPLDQHARFLEKLEALSPKAVGYLVDMNRVNQAQPDLFRGEWGNRFVQSANRLEGRGIPVLLGTPFDVTGEVLPPYPLSSLSHAIAVIHKDGNVFSEDKVTRRALLKLYDKPTFHLDLARRLGLSPSNALPRGAYFESEVEAEYFFFRYHGSPASKPGQPSRYTRYSFSDVLLGKLPTDALNGKIVLIGSLTREDTGDFALTPYSKASFANPKLAIHATILDTILHDNGILRAPVWVNWVATFLASTFVIWSVFTYTPLVGVFNTLSAALLFLLAGQLLFSIEGIWVREGQPIIGIFLGYYLAVPYRLIREYKKRWDYQKKNELLMQVEELKTNFLSLVTHDLKTPVARIQGLAEVLLRKAAERLEQTDRETLHHIIASTDELNHFITSILELTKVESNRLQLFLESKDINQLIEKSIEGFRTQARAARIQINVQLDPLFPIKIDPSLISKVLNNLIDNALKYSPAGSQITVESHETGEWVEILVKDQGIGLSEVERTSLFTRFYRAKNDTTTQVTGTGLGLYLTKFFIEAHQGKVEVQSEAGRGSTFKILLPLQFDESKSTDFSSHFAASARDGHGAGLTTVTATPVSRSSDNSSVSKRSQRV
ncbi:MAG: CHASE2 domain-containing protein [Methylotenera sp.]|nr:CHASE2 domain-containing protein [Oligoflexia bacterium]